MIHNDHGDDLEETVASDTTRISFIRPFFGIRIPIIPFNPETVKESRSSQSLAISKNHDDDSNIILIHF